MRFIDMEQIHPHIRHLLADLEAAQAAVLKETDPKRRARLIRRNQPRWTALRQAFEDASYGKCWYTECKNPGADNDIDHFRPKLAVEGEPEHPGYFWLAFNWQNMRLSCQVANRPRRNPKLDRTDGKANHFPLLPKGIRARRPGEELSLECPALLDPTNPADPVLLSFRQNGEVALSPDFRDDPIAVAKFEASRNCLHLDWAKFRDARVMLYNMIERTVIRGQREAPDDIAGMLTASEAFKDAMRDLHRFTNPQEEYSAAARVYVESFKHVWWVQQIVLRLSA